MYCPNGNNVVPDVLPHDPRLRRYDPQDLTPVECGRGLSMAVIARLSRNAGPYDGALGNVRRPNDGDAPLQTASAINSSTTRRASHTTGSGGG